MLEDLEAVGIGGREDFRHVGERLLLEELPTEAQLKRVTGVLLAEKLPESFRVVWHSELSFHHLEELLQK